MPSREFRDHVGDAWYQRIVHVPVSWDGGRVVLRFDAAIHRATAYVDDGQVASQEGRLHALRGRRNGLVTPGTTTRVTIVVNDELTFQSIPSRRVDRGSGRRRQTYHHDFFNYAGLHRSVRLSRTPTKYVSDNAVTTGLDGSSGTVSYAVEVAGGDADIEVTLLDADGRPKFGAA